MPEKTSYVAGTPSWVDLASPDVAASTAFYGELFGWDSEDMGPDAGGYTMFKKGGKHVAAVGPQQSPEQPPSWTSYVSVDDADKTIEIAQANGATTLMPAMDVMTAGRMAILADPVGAVIALWQPRDHIGAELTDEPGTLAWTELSTRELDRSKKFYTSVFGWGTHTSPAGDDFPPYTEYKLGDQSVAGMMQTPAEVPPQVPSYWMPYFLVASPDDAVAKVESLGGRVIAPPMDVPDLRMAVVADPHGAMFGVMTFHAKA